MGSGASRLLTACACSRPAPAPADDGPCLDDALGHSFCYAANPSSAAYSSSFRHGISGAALSANSSVPVPIYHSSSNGGGMPPQYSSAFHTSSSFSSAPLQLSNLSSGPLFLSGPIDRGAQLSGPLDQAMPFSGPLPAKPTKPAPSSSSLRGFSRRFRKPSFGGLRRSVSEKNRPCVAPLRREDGVQWAHGRAGEDRVHVVVSEDQRWLFVGIYDGFNGPEAPDFLVANLYRFLLRELRGIFYEEADADSKRLWQFLADDDDEDSELDFSGSGRFALSLSRLKERRHPMWAQAAAAGDGQSSWEWGVRKLTAAPAVRDHRAVLGALTRALATTEAAYLDMTNQSMGSHPELAVTGACLLVVLLKDDDVYVMNLGDSRAIVAQRRDGGDNCVLGTLRVENIGVGLKTETRPPGYAVIGLEALQLSTDHSTSIEEEVQRIKREHPDDDQCIVNDRVKGRLKVTRAFGAGYLKQAKLNDGLLEMFRNEYIGDTPYISCTPSLCHHKLSVRDKFLVLSSDGLYQYLTNEEVVLHVENFMERFPEGDPAQSLIEDLLSRAAKKAGMDFYELLDIPQGDRRKYHDDVTVMVISLEGRIWKSSGTYV
ncbi:probable protein phosphatase 2C 26 [Phragmites australis]|uniref:probable protein phosphatase 2C 26 n=1 Tax=Phragmites australis TaxID=29695 RepID=UPI002D779836|nr:probable protein phosphatase 2C 26 [Phragmites australis]